MAPVGREHAGGADWGQWGARDSTARWTFWNRRRQAPRAQPQLWNQKPGPAAARPPPPGSWVRGAPGRRDKVGRPLSPTLSPGSAISHPRCAGKTFLLQPTACQRLFPQRAALPRGTCPLMRNNGGVELPRPSCGAIVLLVTAPAHLPEHSSGLWVQRGDTSSEEPLLFAFSLSAGAHLNTGNAEFSFFVPCLFFFFLLVTF